MYEEIIQELKKISAHTIILFGSRARGDFTFFSDIDMMVFRDDIKSYKIARWDKHNRA